MKIFNVLAPCLLMLVLLSCSEHKSGPCIFKAGNTATWDTKFFGLVKHGLYTSYYPSGRRGAVVTYINGKQEGVATVWYESGHKMIESHYKHGMKHGKRITWFENGLKSMEEDYQNGLRSGMTIEWDKNGNKLALETWLKGHKNGKSVEWYESGQIKSEINYRNGKKDGIESSWLATGTVNKTISWHNDKMNGVATEWFPSGSKRIEVNHKNGLQDGIATEWYENGQKKTELFYKHGLQDGIATTWFIDGAKENEVYYESGSNVKTYWYKNGYKFDRHPDSFNLEKWHLGGNLQDKTIKDWKDATYDNRLATCSNWLMTGNAPVIEAICKNNMKALLLPAAMLLSKMEDRINSGNYNDNQALNAIALECMIEVNSYYEQEILSRAQRSF